MCTHCDLPTTELRGVLFENNWLSTTFSVRAFHLIALVLLTIQVLLSCRRGASDGSTGMEEVLHGWIVVGVACKRILSAAPHLSFSPSCFNESLRKQLLLLILPSASPTVCVRVRFVEKLDFPQQQTTHTLFCLSASFDRAPPGGEPTNPV